MCLRVKLTIKRNNCQGDNLAALLADFVFFPRQCAGVTTNRSENTKISRSRDSSGYTASPTFLNAFPIWGGTFLAVDGHHS